MNVKMSNYNLISTPIPPNAGFRVKQFKQLMREFGWSVWPWHEDLLKIMTAFDKDIYQDTGKIVPIFRHVNIVLPRQVGKTQITLVNPIDHLIREDLHKGSHSIYTSQGATNSLAILKTKFFPKIDETEIKGNRFKTNSSTTAPGIENTSNTRYMNVLSASSNAGRGLSPELVIIDEVLELKNYSRVESLTGGQINIEEAQLIYLSTAPKEYSVVLHREIEDCVNRIEKFKESGDWKDIGRKAIFMTQVPEGVDIWSDEAILAVNPSIGCDKGPALWVLQSKRDELINTSPETWSNEYLNIPIPLKTDDEETRFNYEKIKLVDKIESDFHMASVVCNPEKTEWFSSVSDGKRIKFLGKFNFKRELNSFPI